MVEPLDIYRSLASDLGAAEIGALRREVRAHYEELVEAQEKSELLAIDLAGLLAARIEGLLAEAEGLEAEHRAAVVGAARYFVSMQDAVPDAQACIGLDDDVAVFNHVAVAIGRPDLIIDE
ncbi:MAG: DUF1232 domain-containing protein [Polyangiaceae bacterium]